MVSYRVSVRLIACMLFTALTATIAVAQQRTDFGTLSFQVRPPDAEIFIDGERWTGPEGPGPLEVQVAPGTHRVEIRSPGRQTFVRTLSIRAGETLPLNVSLTQAEPEGPAPAELPPAPRHPGPPPSAAPPSGIVRATASRDGFVFAPDFRVTEINHETSGLVGGYGGYVFDGRLLVGGGGYWQTNSTNGAHLTYGGPVLEWRLFADSTVGVNLHGLVGAGWRYFDYGDFAYYGDGGFVHPRPLRGGRYSLPYGHLEEAFFVAEPEAQIVVRFAPSARLQGGVGYRATSANGLSGLSGSISVQIGR